MESAWSTCLALGEQPQLEGSVQGRDSFLAAHHLAVLHEQMGRVEQARQYQQLARALREGQAQI
ncbi:hypothetical protein [Halochromatium salexigens]|uniref:Tetratricopeptide repeat protein n=1 Tax=Halochromatium salexigens TaxID=49447 RepID=A0AAJ0UEH2_HALSE|nr:hypothetical protein [Halochromatium salexigens]MBK5929959.1 hypothetical protein [Halochromatium salexigens]